MQVQCPRCKKKVQYNTDNRYRPFCSERCRLIDLGEWADEKFRIEDNSSQSEVTEEDIMFQDDENSER